MEYATHHGSPPIAGIPLLLLAGLLLAGLLLAYLAAVIRLRRRSVRWRATRVASFAIGITLLAITFVPPLAAFVHTSMRGHMAQHLLLGMLAPLGLVFGAPGTLLLRSVPVPTARRLVRFLGSRPLRVLTHPVTAAVLDVGGMYLLYLTPLFALTLATPLLANLMHLHFVVAGYLFTWTIAGPDPAPHRPGRWMRLAALFGATAAHAILAKLMYGYGFPRGTPYDLAELQAAAQWMYYGGDLSEALLAVAFFGQWMCRHRSGPVPPPPTSLFAVETR